MNTIGFSEAIILLFLSVLFLQSGFDKVIDYKGNKNHVDSVFSKTFLAPTSGLMFLVITILELVAGVLCIVGIFSLYFSKNSQIAIMGLQTAAITLLCLFLGQRVAKDYAGAASLVPYFLLAVFGLYIFH